VMRHLAVVCDLLQFFIRLSGNGHEEAISVALHGDGLCTARKLVKRQQKGYFARHRDSLRAMRTRRVDASPATSRSIS
jgi:hypothetical protein